MIVDKRESASPADPHSTVSDEPPGGGEQDGDEAALSERIRMLRASSVAVAVLVLAASATIAFGAAPGEEHGGEHTLAVAATPPGLSPSAVPEPTGEQVLITSERFEATETPTVTPSATAEATAAAPVQERSVAASGGGSPATGFIATSGASYSSGTVKAWARQAGWPEGALDEVVAVAWCESRHRPAASNGIAYGLMQVVPLWFSYAGVPFSQWSDPVANLRVAYAAYRYDLNRGYAPWTQWQCKPYMVAAPPADEEVVAPLPAAEPATPVPPTTAPTEPPATPVPPTATATPPPTEAPTEPPAEPTAPPSEVPAGETATAS